MAQRSIQVTWDSTQHGAEVQVNNGGMGIEIPRHWSSARGTEALPSTGTTRWRLSVPQSGGITIGICSDKFQKFDSFPYLQKQSWVWLGCGSCGKMFAEERKVAESSKWIIEDGAQVDVIFDADDGRLTFELDSQPLQGFEGVCLPRGGTFYPIVGAGLAGGSVLSLPIVITEAAGCGHVEAVPWNNARVFLESKGRTGKTSTTRSLLGNPCDENVKTTKGADIEQCDISRLDSVIEETQQEGTTPERKVLSDLVAKSDKGTKATLAAVESATKRIEPPESAASEHKNIDCAAGSQASKLPTRMRDEMSSVLRHLRDPVRCADPEAQQVHAQGDSPVSSEWVLV